MASQYRRRSLMLNTIAKVAQGNPTIITDSSSRRLQKLNVYGQSEQDSTTGAQLFDILKATPRTNTFGLTVTIDGDYILINGSVENLSRKDFRIINTDVSFEGKICKAFDVMTTNCSVAELLPSVGESNIVIHLNVTALENISCKFKLMISDKDPASWEPYTGGKPSPSPDYPQEIFSKEVSEIKVTGKNLANIQEFEKVYNGNTFEALYEDDKITYSGADDWSGCGIVLNQTFKKGQYTIQAKGVVILLSDIALPSFKYNEYWNGKGYPYLYKFTQLNQKVSFNSDFPFKIGFVAGDINTGNSTVSGTMEQVQIELSSEATSYEPYKSQSITLSEPITLRGLPVTLVDGNIVINGEQYISDCIKEKDGIIGVERNLNELLVSSLGSTNLIQGAHTNGQNYLLCTVGSAYRLTIPLSNRYRGTLFTMNDKCVYIPSPAGFVITDSRFTDKETAISITTEEQTKVVYVMNEPTFEPLPEEVQAQYKALKSYYPNTVIQTGCWNEVTYSAKRGG